MPTALELDRAYLACVDRLDDLVRALDRARVFLRERNLDVDAAPDIAFESVVLVGRTAPAYALYRAFVVNDAVVARAHGRLAALLLRLRTEWNVGLCEVGAEHKDGEAGLESTADPVVPERGLVRLDVVRSDGIVVWRGWAPGLYAPPPRSIRTDTHEWRRWYVAYGA